MGHTRDELKYFKNREQRNFPSYQLHKLGILINSHTSLITRLSIETQIKQ